MDNKHTNRLINEKSPYLLQHAHNPVEWYPWGEEAFAKAIAEDKPVFLSIGYSTCHWCHVMERESFEDEDIAKLLNDSFVPIKVDREERPDIDHIYMSVCQTLTGSGGWPLTVIMTPEKKPFFAGTYFPREAKYDHPGLTDILVGIADGWQKNKHYLLDHAEQITNVIISEKDDHSPEEIAEEIFEIAYNQFLLSYKSNYGGFSDAPKFPSPHNLMFLLRYWRSTGTDKALEMVEATLKAMRRGGIYDHLGGGFARYSTDERWLVPHFEKMSYDNSLLCYAYLEAYQCLKDPDYAEVAEEILTYILRDMTGPEGQFYSAEDADSEGVEGKFYLWEKKDIIDILGAEEGELFCECYDVTKRGNFEEGNILNFIDKNWPEIASNRKMALSGLRQSLALSRKKLLEVRESRVHPFKDDKVLTSWNALMIAAMAKAARILDREEYAQAAGKALDFITGNLVRPDGRLLARYRDGEAAHLATINDYANLVWSLIELFETTQRPDLLKQAIHWSREMIRLFEDEQNGGFFLSGSDAEKLITQPKEVYDGATPSGNSVAAYALVRLARLTELAEFEKTAERTFAAFAQEVKFFPKAYPFFLMAYGYYLAPPKHIVIAGSREDEGVRQMWLAARQTFMPEALVLLSDAITSADTEVTFSADMPPLNGKATAYICENLACQQPLTNIDEFKQALSK